LPFEEVCTSASKKLLREEERERERERERCSTARTEVRE